MTNKKVRFQAHRGVSSSYPENTISAYKAAADEGYDVIELDTKFTLDGICICLHDGTLNRTCRHSDGSELAEKTPADSLTLAQIRELDAGLFKSEKFEGERIPTLAETLAFVRDYSSLTVKLDNCFQSFNQLRFEEFCRVVREADMEERIGMTCKTVPYLKLLAEEFPKAELHYDGTQTPAVLQLLKDRYSGRSTVWVPFDNPANSWNRERRADAEFCAELHKYAEVGTFLLSEEEELRTAVEEYGVDIIETNGKLKPRKF